jgi:tRNA(Ile)-lysidine synthase TilS/MesJ
LTFISYRKSNVNRYFKYFYEISDKLANARLFSFKLFDSHILFLQKQEENPIMQKMMGLVRRCAEDYNMIAPGDKIAVGVSGGKDSLVLLQVLAGLRQYMDFSLVAVTIDMGLGMDYSGIAGLCERLEVPFHLVQTQIGPIIFDHRKEKNPCSMCSKMRRGALNQAILDLGIRKIALGHHYDDAVETFVMSLIYEGRISCFQPVTDLDRTGVIQIRPMLYVHEKTVENFAKRMELPVVENRCPVDKHTKREEIKNLVYTLSQTYPDLKERIFGAMQRLPLPEWGPQGRYKRPVYTEEEA